MTMEDFPTPHDLGRMGAWGIVAESARLMRHNFSLFFSFVLSFTAPHSAFTVLLVAAIDLNRHYTMDDFFAQEQKQFFGLRFTPLTPEALHLLFLLLNMVPLAWLNTVVCARGVINIYAQQNLASALKDSYEGLPWGALRVVATQVWFYLACSLFIVAQTCLGPLDPPNSSNLWLILTNALNLTGLVILPLLLFCFLYPLPAQHIAALEPPNYGIQGYSRAANLVTGKKRVTSINLAILTILYVVVLKLLVDFALQKSFPFWTQFVAYPPLVLFVIAMSIFWQVAFTILYLSCVARNDPDVFMSLLSSCKAVKEEDEEAAAAAEFTTDPLLANRMEGNEDGVGPVLVQV